MRGHHAAEWESALQTRPNKKGRVVSSYLVLADVSKTLQRILWDGFNQEPALRAIVGSEAAIVFKNPTETAQDSANRLSLWLYQITENEYVKNQPMVRSNGRNAGGAGNKHSALQFPPLALNLFYLVTPFTPSGESDQLLLGKAMQLMYDNATILLQNPADGIAEDLRIILCRLTLEELTRIWEALQEPYRLSVCYQVRVTRVDSARTQTQPRVVELDAAFGHKLVVTTE
jgi:hypothetical protein